MSSSNPVEEAFITLNLISDLPSLRSVFANSNFDQFTTQQLQRVAKELRKRNIYVAISSAKQRLGKDIGDTWVKHGGKAGPGLLAVLKGQPVVPGASRSKTVLQPNMPSTSSLKRPAPSSSSHYFSPSSGRETPENVRRISGLDAFIKRIPGSKASTHHKPSKATNSQHRQNDSLKPIHPSQIMRRSGSTIQENPMDRLHLSFADKELLKVLKRENALKDTSSIALMAKTDQTNERSSDEVKEEKEFVTERTVKLSPRQQRCWEQLKAQGLPFVESMEQLQKCNWHVTTAFRNVLQQLHKLADARQTDLGALESEQLHHAELERQKKNQVDELAFVDIVEDNVFPNSSLVNNSMAVRSAVSIVEDSEFPDPKSREQAMQLLRLEQDSQTWFRRGIVKPFFEELSKEMTGSKEPRLITLQNAVQKVTKMLYSMPDVVGGVPLEFLKAKARAEASGKLVNEVEENAVEVIENFKETQGNVPRDVVDLC